MASCCRDDCSAPVGRNGVACHAHYQQFVPSFVTRALFAKSDDFTRKWLIEQVRHLVREEQITP